MTTLEMQVDALMRLCAAEKESDRVQARQEICRLLENGRRAVDPEAMVRQILLELGAPDHQHWSQIRL